MQIGIGTTQVWEGNKVSKIRFLHICTIYCKVLHIYISSLMESHLLVYSNNCLKTTSHSSVWTLTGRLAISRAIASKNYGDLPPYDGLPQYGGHLPYDDFPPFWKQNDAIPPYDRSPPFWIPINYTIALGLWTSWLWILWLWAASFWRSWQWTLSDTRHSVWSDLPCSFHFQHQQHSLGGDDTLLSKCITEHL